jgi:hypothetical protein
MNLIALIDTPDFHGELIIPQRGANGSLLIAAAFSDPIVGRIIKNVISEPLFRADGESFTKEMQSNGRLHGT